MVEGIVTVRCEIIERRKKSKNDEKDWKKNNGKMRLKKKHMKKCWSNGEKQKM